MPKQSEVDRIDPLPVTVKLESGQEIEVVRMRTRQMMRFLRILTNGAAPQVISSLAFDSKADEFAGRLMASMILAIPNAEEDAIGFIQSMTRPLGLHETQTRKDKLSKEQEAENVATWDAFNEDLFNPLPGDTLTILEAIVEHEAPEIQALGKRLQSLIETLGKVFPRDSKDEKAADAETPATTSS